MKTGTRTIRQIVISAAITSAICIGAVFGQGIAHAATYYVATTGHDSNPGTSAQPFRTINKGAGVLKPRDTLYVRGGTYTEAILNTIPAGTDWNNPVTVAAYPGEKVVLKPSGTDKVVHLGQGKRYIIIDGLILDAINTIKNYSAVVYMDGDTRFIRIKNSELMNSPRHGILGGSWNEYINLKIHNNGTDHFDHGIYTSGNDNVIDGCEIYKNTGYGVHIYGGSVANYNIVRNNKIYDNRTSGASGTGILLGSGRGNIAYNNIVWGGNHTGIEAQYGARDTKIFNNTVYGNVYYGISVRNATNTLIKNNIVFKNGISQIIDTGANTSGTIIQSNLTIDPKFANVTTLDFRLQSSSPAIDMGQSLVEVTKDFTGLNRPQGARHDIGAYEFPQGTQISPPKNLRIVSE